MNTATQLKFDGLEKAAKHHEADLRLAQLIALALGSDGTVVSSDDVRQAFEYEKGRPLKIGNAMGKLFDCHKWDRVGVKKSSRPESHARLIGTWQRKRKEAEPPPLPSVAATENGVRFCPECNKEFASCQCGREQ